MIKCIPKELKIIKYFLDSQKNSKDKTIEELRKKILKEIRFWEGKKSTKNIWKRSKSSSKVNNDKILSLTNEEKDLLKKYLSSISEDSFTTIIASKDNNSNGIKVEKIQVILEFLFFIRDKTIDIIHLLNKSASLFFEFLKPGLNGEQVTQSEQKIESFEANSNDEEDNENDDIEELQKEFNSNIEINTSKNEEIFNKLSVSSINDINCLSAREFIFNFKSSTDYFNELKYLFENIVLPERNIKIGINNIKNDKIEINYYSILQKKIESIYKELDDKFKHDPLYESIIQYFENLSKAKKK